MAKVRNTILTYSIPIKGLNTDDDSAHFAVPQTPRMTNMYVSRNIISKRRGITQVGNGSSVTPSAGEETTYLPLRGIGMELATYVDAVGGRHEIALTTTDAYRYNTSDDGWDNINEKEVLDDCDSGWTGGSDVTASHDTTVKKEGTGSVKLLTTDAITGRDTAKLGFSGDFGAVDITGNNAIGFWIRSSIALSSGDIRIVIAEDSAGARTNDFVDVDLDEDIAADTWRYIDITTTLTDINAAVSVGIYANVDIASGVAIYIDNVVGLTQFIGGDTNNWSFAEAYDPEEFDNNEGSARVISNGVDDLFYFEGDSGDTFTTLVHTSGVANAKIIREFWNHFMMFNYDNNENVRGEQHSDIGDIADWNSGKAGATTLTDSIGKILNVYKLRDAMIIYSEYSMTICRYYGGITTFAFPTLVHGIGPIAARAIWAYHSMHFLLCNDQRAYMYRGESDLIRISVGVESNGIFNELNVDKTEYMVTGADKRRKKVHFAIPVGSAAYARYTYAFNYDAELLCWERHTFGIDIRAFGYFQNSFAWFCDDTVFTGVYCDERDFYCDESFGQIGYETTTILSSDGFVYKLDNNAITDDGAAIFAELETPTFTVNEEEQYGRWKWFSFQARTTVAGSLLYIIYMDSEGNASPFVSQPVTLNNRWTTHRLPFDLLSRRVSIYFFQLVGDVQFKGLFKAAVVPQPERD